MGYNGIVEMGISDKFEVPYHWESVVLSEWHGQHIAWLKELELTWQIDFYVTDQDELDNSSQQKVRKVYFLFNDPKHATMFALRWAF